MKTQLLRKVVIALTRDADGYPPVEWEEMWAENVDGHLYRIESIPFYAPLLSYQDIVYVREEGADLVIESVAEYGGHSTIRIVCYTDALVSPIREGLKEIGCMSELSNVSNFFSVDVPPNVSLDRVFNFLAAFSSDIDVDESALQHDK
jgi:hypothetical protein